MINFRNIEILEKDNNKKGDLFGRLMNDLFHSLGYDEPRLNIHKSGREIDLQTFHRVEKKIAIAECKAHKDKIGGDDINKFIGVLDAEKRRFKRDKHVKTFTVSGYFVSLSGFKETAIEQEKEISDNRVLLIKPEKIIEELIAGRIIVSIEKAVSAVSHNNETLLLANYIDLFGYDKGWVWVLYFSNSQGQKTSHFAFVHADGKPLISELASELISIDAKTNSLLRDLILIPGDSDSSQITPSKQETTKKYFKYLENECGEIQFEGLPTDKEAGAVRVQLESIFVPLHFSQVHNHDENTPSSGRISIGNILSISSRLAILAKPGGGKSTLIKRIAIAYAFPDRRVFINDSLPDNDWFPIFIRCRELGEKVTHSITDIINGIPVRAEISECKNQFSKIISDVLQKGNALLLIDGLDEIAEDRNRVTFVNQLRTFIATYPKLNIIVTSREAGFRAVAGTLETYCEQFKVSNLNEPEIEALTLKWHKAIIDDSENTIKEAIKISNLIIKDNRIKVLAENPLLLTTLLFVKRWAGYLPTKRTVLYQEMIKLLLVTWNVEGHDQLDIEEAEPQLSFVAFWMTKNGKQTITEGELKDCLIECRRQMPEILGYTKISPTDFIKRVESRSSLLILSGHKRNDVGQLLQIYEFLHLSFQEYLTAKAIVKSFLPSEYSFKNKIEIIAPNLSNENWKEVIPITAVLLERDAKNLVELLINESKKIALKEDTTNTDRLVATLLGSCIANEIQIGPELLDSAIEWYAKNNYTIGAGLNETILNSKFGPAFRRKVTSSFFGEYDDQFVSPLGSLLSEIFMSDFTGEVSKLSIQLNSLLIEQEKVANCTAVLGLMGFAWEIATDHRPSTQTDFHLDITLKATLINFLKTNDNHYIFSCCWTIAWLGDAKLIPDEFCQELFDAILPIWIESTYKSVSRKTAWALNYLIMPNSKIDYLKSYPRIKEIVNERLYSPRNEFENNVCLCLGVLLGINWSRKDVAKALKESKRHQRNDSRTINRFIKYLKLDKDISQQELKFE
ncbi:NACHT domain-containing protein [Mucilaginibacter auburnensis]|uniref:Restriction endonuclease n=1 Tax=Mucilaginibacter auburnensis TaxID=1457233 RepID=A0A2H9VLJ9_9SPHI|nr:NACHT domain-containing protein [Mucilaginibacter auburnensis]PJJ79217.1 restriction endonuclease [Mucilaginibacter auburnensis]